MRAKAIPIAAFALAAVSLVAWLTTVRANVAQSPPAAAPETAAPTTYFIAEGDERTGFRPPDRQLARWALEAWQRSAASGLTLEPAIESRALIRVYWAEAVGGQYGEMRPLMVEGRRGAAVFIRPDLDALGEDIAQRARRDELLRDTIVYLTCLHELGHALGLPHTSDFRDIMYFFGYGGDIIEYFERYRRPLRSRSDIATHSGLSEDDVSRLRALHAPPTPRP